MLENYNCWSFVGSILNYGQVFDKYSPNDAYYKDINVLIESGLVWAGVPGNKVEIEVDGKKMRGVKKYSQNKGSITCGLSGSTGTKLTCQGEVQTNDLDDADADDGNQVVSTGDGSQVGSTVDGSQDGSQVGIKGVEQPKKTFANRVSNFFSSFSSKSQPKGGKRSKRRMDKKGKTRKNKKGKMTRKLRKRK